MAEYLAPAVYVEEVDSGNKPIEGVSTSTAGLVGVAERGPLDVPILVTSIGEYERWFGGRLPKRDFIDINDPARAHCYLPHAVEGFFTNGGKRAYVVRVAPGEAKKAAGFLYDGAQAGDASTLLLRPARQGGGVALPLYVLDRNAIASGDTLRIGDGSRAEYRTVNGAPAPGNHILPLSAPLRHAHDANVANSVEVHAAGAAPVAGTTTLNAGAVSGATLLTLKNTTNSYIGVAVPFLLEISENGISDIVVVNTAPVAGSAANLFDVTLTEPLPRTYTASATVTSIASVAPTDALETPAAPGDRIVFGNANLGGPGDICEVGRGTAGHEARRVGSLASFALGQPLPSEAPAGSIVAHITPPADEGSIGTKKLSAAAAVGSRVISLDDRVGLAVGQLLRIGASPNDEYATITAIGGERGAAPDAGTVTLGSRLAASHSATANVAVQKATTAANHGSTATLFSAEAGSSSIIVHTGHSLAANDYVSITRPDGTISLHQLGAAGAFANIGAVTLSTGLDRDHEAGEAAVERRQLIRIEALDVGDWGNRLLISAEDEVNGLSTRTQTTMVNAPSEIRVGSLTGIEPGTVLEVTNPGTAGTVLLKVKKIDRTNRSITFDGAGLDAAAMATLGLIGGPLDVRSREFALTVRLKRRPDPAVPSRDSMIVATETFRNLSMDSRHSRYFVKVIGAIAGPLRLEDRRPEGDSAFIRIAESNPAANTTSVRTGPETLTDLLPSGMAEPARYALSGGSDSVPTIDDDTYLGLDDVEPVKRTGLQALKNILTVSIVAIPGQASTGLQAGLIAHCELMRYRFAVLDSRLADGSLADVQQQRQAFDTKYAGLYYPWLTVPDPHPETLTVIRDFALPPSGHMIGIYARTDEERGVHKAPANEVVRGITGLTKRLSKGEQDVLNPSPVNINVIRDFRAEGRGIRAWGARCITSDSDYKYVPVRRLLIFLERSIEQGLQWVVFEPNAERLWARVRSTIGAFLKDVWRSGALEGVKPEEAFFVRCDRTTMTQSDIDNGRLICVIGVAPVKPAEFVIVRIGLFTAHSEE